MRVSKLSEFIQSDVPSNTLLLIPNEFGTVFERLEELEKNIQYSQALAKPEEEIFFFQTDSHRILSVFSRFFIAAIRSIEK